MKDNIIDRVKQGGESLSKKNKPIAAPSPVVNSKVVIQQKMQKLSIKWNALTLMIQECGESMQDLVNEYSRVIAELEKPAEVKPEEKKA